MNVNFSIISPLEYRVRKKAEMNLAISQRALGVIDEMIQNDPLLGEGGRAEP